MIGPLTKKQYYDQKLNSFLCSAEWDRIRIDNLRNLSWYARQCKRYGPDWKEEAYIGSNEASGTIWHIPAVEDLGYFIDP